MDESRRMCLDTVRNYIHYMQEHGSKDLIVTADRIREAENLLSNHARTWVKICRIGGGITIFVGVTEP